MLSHFLSPSVIFLHILLTSASPLAQAQQGTDANLVASNNASSLQAPSSDDGNERKPFEFYFNNAIKSGQESLEEFGGDRYPYFAEIIPFDGQNFRMRSSDNAADFVKMEVRQFGPTAPPRLQGSSSQNWNMKSFRALDFFETKIKPVGRALEVFQTFSDKDLVKTLATVFDLLKKAGWTDTWKVIYIGKYRDPSEIPLPNEVFYALYGANTGDWVYVGAQTGGIWQGGARIPAQEFSTTKEWLGSGTSNSTVHSQAAAEHQIEVGISEVD